MSLGLRMAAVPEIQIVVFSFLLNFCVGNVDGDPSPHSLVCPPSNLRMPGVNWLMI